MKLVLAGTGQMGQAVERMAVGRGHSVSLRFDENRPITSITDPASEGIVAQDVVVDFTLPTTVVANIERYCTWGIPAVIGTTGWYSELDRVQDLVRSHDASIFYAPNFSVGVAILVQALKSVTPLLEVFPEYDPFIHEAHHVRKVDSPSGTALLLGQVLVDGLTRKTHIDAETQHSRIDPAALHVAASRGGNVVGHHTVMFDSPYDTLSFTHDAHNRDGFAYGAVRAAEWLVGRKGLFTLDDMLADAGL